MTIERERPVDETTVLDLSGADEFDDEYFLDGMTTRKTAGRGQSGCTRTA